MWVAIILGFLMGTDGCPSSTQIHVEIVLDRLNRPKVAHTHAAIRSMFLPMMCDVPCCFVVVFVPSLLSPKTLFARIGPVLIEKKRRKQRRTLNWE